MRHPSLLRGGGGGSCDSPIIVSPRRICRSTNAVDVRPAGIRLAALKRPKCAFPNGFVLQLIMATTSARCITTLRAARGPFGLSGAATAGGFIEVKLACEGRNSSRRPLVYWVVSAVMQDAVLPRPFGNERRKQIIAIACNNPAGFAS